MFETIESSLLTITISLILCFLSFVLAGKYQKVVFKKVYSKSASVEKRTKLSDEEVKAYKIHILFLLIGSMSATMGVFNGLVALIKHTLY